MKKNIVLGIGSRIMKDDGIGVAVAEFLQDKLKKEEIRVIIGETDYLFCEGIIKDCDILFLIDAVISDRLPGTISIQTINEAVKKLKKPYSAHEMSLFDSLLFYKNIKGYLIGIEVAEISYSLEFSSVIQENLANICLEVEKIIKKIMGELRMHDTFLFEKIFEELTKQCRINSLGKINKISLSVSSDSHINENNLSQYLQDRNNKLFGDWTKIRIQKEEKGTLTAFIKSIEGEKAE